MRNIILSLLFVLVSCGNKKPQNTIETCRNWGHRLGGDLVGKDNTIWAMDKVIHKQDNACFRCWEFDVNSSKDVPVAFHDKSYKGTRVHKIPSRKIPGNTVRELVDAFNIRRMDLIRPFCVDVKKVRFSDFVKIKEMMDTVEDYRFITHRDRKKELKKHIKYAEDNGISFGYYK